MKTVKKHIRRTGEFTEKKKCHVKLLPDTMKWAMDKYGMTKNQVIWRIYYSADSPSNLEFRREILEHNQKLLNSILINKDKVAEYEKQNKETQRLIKEASSSLS